MASVIFEMRTGDNISGSIMPIYSGCAFKAANKISLLAEMATVLLLNITAVLFSLESESVFLIQLQHQNCFRASSKKVHPFCLD